MWGVRNMQPGDFQVRHHAVLRSTNDEARRLAEAGCAHGTVVWADEQTAGHGRYGRPWFSPKGNLLVSVVLRPNLAPQRAAELGFLAAAAVADCVSGLLADDARTELKWPNDVQVEGAKIAGLLAEAQSAGDAIAWVVLGVGLNLAQAPEDAPYPVTRVAAHGATVAPEQALQALLADLARWLGRWESEGFGVVRAAWLARARGLGREVVVRLCETEARGIFRDLDTDGAMILETDTGPRRITAGDVAFSPA